MGLHAQMRIGHQRGDMLRGVRTALGHPHDARALEAFAVEGLPFPADKIPYAVDAPGYRALCFPFTSEELQILVQSDPGTLQSACESIWSAVSAVKGGKPALLDVVIVDTARGSEILRGVTGVKALRRWREGLAVLGTAALTAVWLALAPLLFEGAQTWDIVIGAAPALLAGLGYVLAGIRGRGTIIWAAP